MVMLREQIYQKTLRHFFQPVEDLLFEKPEVTEVLINGPDRIYCESGGKLPLGFVLSGQRQRLQRRKRQAVS